VNPDINLRGLSLARPHPPPGGGGFGRILGRYGLPLIVLAGFAGSAAWSARERLLPRHPVTVAPVVASGGTVAAEDEVLFQAAGWVEPEPFPLLVTPQAAGVVRTVEVLEGQAVAAGQVVARLIDEDAKIAVARADAELRTRQAEQRIAEAALAAARTDWENPVDLRRDLAAAEAVEARLREELRVAEAAVAEADAEVAARRLELEIQADQTAKGVQSDRPRQAAALALKRAEAARASAKARSAVPAAQAEAAGIETAAARERLRLRTADTRRLAEAEAAVAQAKARVAAAQAERDAADLQLRRMEVKAPGAGVVLSRTAVPGTRVATGGAGEAHAVGLVLRSTSLADIQKNTPAVKVRILELEAVRESDYYGDMARAYRPIQYLAGLMAAMIAAAGLFGGMNTLYAAVAGRTREFATVQALGFGRRAVVVSLLQESLLTSAAAALPAAAVAVFALDGLAVRFTMGAFTLRIDETAMGLGLATAAALGLLGALPPAFRALRMPITDALKS
jgi:multidrug efflux pump subunit AcrA (membrane-fusion protein)